MHAFHQANVRKENECILIKKATDFHAPRENPVLIIQLNKHTIKMSPTDLFLFHRLVYSSVPIREVSCNTWHLTKRYSPQLVNFQIAKKKEF